MKGVVIRIQSPVVMASLTVLSLFWLMTGCFHVMPQDSRLVHTSFLETEWHLYRFGDVGGNVPLILETARWNRPITVTFAQGTTSSSTPFSIQRRNEGSTMTDSEEVILAGIASGWTGCNQYNTEFDRRAFRLKLSIQGSTLMSCPPELFEQQQTYFDTLEKTASYRLSGGYLILFDRHGEPRLTYRAADCEEPERACPSPPTEATEALSFGVVTRPSKPVPDEEVTLVVTGTWPMTCKWPSNPQVAVANRTIRITTTPSPALVRCQEMLKRVTFEVELGSLPAGTYSGEIVYALPDRSDILLGNVAFSVEGASR